MSAMSRNRTFAADHNRSSKSPERAWSHLGSISTVTIVSSTRHSGVAFIF